MVTTDRFEKWLLDQRHLSPAKSLRASSLGWPCERRLWYDQREWQEAALPTVGLQGIFAWGRDFEQALIRRLMEAGYSWRASQLAREWPHFNITGHIEGEISEDGVHWTLAEVKGIHPNFFDRVTTWRDFLSMGPIYSQYAAQVQLYLLLDNVESMVLIVGKKGTYWPVKFLPVELDLEYAESLLRKAERVNRAVENGPIPDRTDDAAVCQPCPYKLHCLPSEDFGPGAELLDDPDLLAQLHRRDELAPLRAEYEATDKAIKTAMKGRPLVLIDEYRITGKEVSRKGYEVKPSAYWDTRILNLKAAPEGPA